MHNFVQQVATWRVVIGVSVMVGHVGTHTCTNGNSPCGFTHYFKRVGDFTLFIYIYIYIYIYIINIIITFEFILMVEGGILGLHFFTLYVSI